MRTHSRRIQAVILSSMLLTSLLLQDPTSAMGSGNKYVDAQTGLSYQVFQPTYTQDLILRSFRLMSCGPTGEQWLTAIYGEQRYVQFLENDGAVHCTNPGLGVQVATASINGAKAKIVAFCDPANAKQWKNCKSTDIQNYGGYALWQTKAAHGLRATSVEVLVSGVTYTNLLKMARGLRPVTKG